MELLRVEEVDHSLDLLGNLEPEGRVEVHLFVFAGFEFLFHVLAQRLQDLFVGLNQLAPEVEELDLQRA